MRMIIFFTTMFLFNCACSTETREPAVAGKWYPNDKVQLEQMLKGFFDKAILSADTPKEKPFALISPHAGFIYSGPVAAYSYNLVKNGDYDTVIIIGASHHSNRGIISVYDGDFFKTPLGTVPIDKDIVNELVKADPRIKKDKEVHKPEHSIEAQVPFLQYKMKNFKIVPVLTAANDFELFDKVADAIIKIMEKSKKKILLVASTDMSHYHDYNTATVMDKSTTGLITAKKWDELKARISAGSCELCGFDAVYIAGRVIRYFKADNAVLLNYANSGDTVPASASGGVVGYTAIAFYKNAQATTTAEDKTELTPAEKKAMLELARKSIDYYLDNGKPYEPDKPASTMLNTDRAVFVTLKKHGELRGCIGQMIATTYLYKAVNQMAFSAAFKDPRFQPVKKEEMRDIHIEISVLTPMKKVKNADEIVMKRDGVHISKGYNSGVFLPQVATETGWDKATFLGELCSQKAGLPADCWKDPAADIRTFQVLLFEE